MTRLLPLALLTALLTPVEAPDARGSQTSLSVELGDVNSRKDRFEFARQLRIRFYRTSLAIPHQEGSVTSRTSSVLKKLNSRMKLSGDSTLTDGERMLARFKAVDDLQSSLGSVEMQLAHAQSWFDHVIDILDAICLSEDKELINWARLVPALCAPPTAIRACVEQDLVTLPLVPGLTSFGNLGADVDTFEVNSRGYGSSINREIVIPMIEELLPPDR